MTTARSQLVDLETTPYYHCLTRCVRRAFLCGQDERSGRNFDHRKAWIVERVKLLASLFAIDVCAYAVLSNHLHLILRVIAQLVAEWSDEEVLRRAGLLCPTSVHGVDTWTADRRRQVVEIWRGRLGDISWFMRLLDEHIAVRANAEDGCGGRFWEGRFKSKALLDEGALLTSMAYVDLNPVRAGIATGLDDSTWTSIHQRLREAAATLGPQEAEPSEEPRADASPAQDSAASPQAPRVESPPAPELRQCPALAPMDGDPQGRSESLPLTLEHYIALLEWTGRELREDKPGAITSAPPELLARCGLDPARWLDGVERFGDLGGFVGHPRRLKERAEQLGRRWLKGQGGSTVAYAMAA